jgi:DNA-binding response OmpR family regulator
MPEMNGREFYEKAKELKPGLKVLYMSGYSADILEGQGMAEAGMKLLKKPFSIAELISSVRNILDR